MSEQRLKDYKVLVTGAGTGIGRGVALAFAKQGAAVVLHYSHSRDGADSAVAQIEAAGGRACALQADFRDAKQARDLAGRLLADFDRLNHIEARPDIGTDRTP